MKLLRDLDIRALLALLIVVVIVGRYAATGDVDLRKTLESAFTIAIGYYLGSSKSSADKDRTGAS